MQLPYIVENSTLVNHWGIFVISDRVANFGHNVHMSSVMFTSSSECFQFNVIVQTDEEYLQIKETINYFKLGDQNTTSSYWFLCISISLVEKNLITNQTANLLL